MTGGMVPRLDVGGPGGVTGPLRLMWMFDVDSDPRLDSNQIQSCHLPVRCHTCHHEISWMQETPVFFEGFRAEKGVLYKGYPDTETNSKSTCQVTPSHKERIVFQPSVFRCYVKNMNKSYL